MNTKDWNPDLYLKFRNERTQPSIDLVSRINVPDPHEIIDIGCEPGNSTEILFNRWPESRITGMDNSIAMIEKARSDYPDINWEIADASKLDCKRKFDIVFSNATIQWIPNHDRFLGNLMNMVNKNGALAVQMPLYQLMPVSEIIDDVFKKLFPGIQFTLNSIFTFHPADYYYNCLTRHSKRIELWETSYFHIMQSCHDILEMIKSTGMKPYLEKIHDDKMKKTFEIEVAGELEKVYNKQPDGAILFPFRRLFFIASN